MLTSKSSAFLPLYILIFVLSHNCYAQVQQEWVRTYSGYPDSYNFPHCIAVDKSGDVYVSGGCTISNRGTFIPTVKYDKRGNVIWSKLDTSVYGSAYFSSLDGAGNLYLYIGIMTSGHYGMTIIKYTSGGSKLWNTFIPGVSNYLIEAIDMKVDVSGNLYLCGLIERQQFNFDWMVMKINTYGVIQWTKYYNGNGHGDDVAHALRVDSQGNVYVTGYTSNIGSSTDYTTIKYNIIGSLLWVNKYNYSSPNSDDNSWAIDIDVPGNVFITGFSGGNGVPYKCTTIKYNEYGIQQWVSRYNDTIDNWPNSLNVDHSGNVVITGDFGVIKYNSLGQVLWHYTEGFVVSSAMDEFDNIYSSMYKYVNPSGINVYTYKLTGSGSKLWGIICSGNPATYREAKISLDTLMNVYQIAGVNDSLNRSLFFTTKYSQLIGISPISSLLPKEFRLLQNYPNPFNPITKIKFDIPSVGTGRNLSVQLAIYDLLGREVATLVNEQLKPGTYEVEWDGTNYPSGVYFYKLTTESFNQTKRMVLIK